MSELEILTLLDHDRQSAGQWSARGRIVREHSADGAECRIIYARCTAEELDDVIRGEIAACRIGRYSLEWKVYGHDRPSDLGDRLLTAGFRADPVESVMVLPLNEEALAAFAAPVYEIRRIHEPEGLDDVAEIAREIGRTNVEEEKRRLASVLRQTPDELSVHVAYIGGAPVASGRIHFKEGSNVAELAGGRTRTTHRNQGLFTALVAARLREALARQRTHVFVDALPTSEPILRKKGFQLVTHTRPFIYDPGE